MRVGWYRETTVKCIDCRYVRSLLVVRQRLVFQITAQKNCVRGVIKGFGRIMPKALKRQFVPKIREAITDDALLAAATPTNLVAGMRLTINSATAMTSSSIEICITAPLVFIKNPHRC